MKIANTDLALQADHAAQTRDTNRETLRAWRGERPDFEAKESSNANALSSAFTRISEAGWRALMDATGGTSGGGATATVLPAPTFSAASGGETAAIDSAIDAAENDPYVSLIRRMLEMLTGKQMKVFDIENLSAEAHQTEITATQSSAAQQATSPGRAGFGIEYDYHAVHEEIETTDFSASGVVRTADGQEISFSLDLQMARYYREETNISLRAGDAVRKDPLVVNFGGTAAQLAGYANQRFAFDLDGDGQLETLPLFASGSGYLALDLNGNGRIDSGKELFGPQSGDGFTDLAVLDDDGNGWIDEGDAAFARLKVWTPAAENNGSLLSLAELDIGALGLAHVATPFALRDGNNNDLGMVKSSGLFLGESGQVGSLQEIDLTV
jgi:hypothetical protein